MSFCPNCGQRLEDGAQRCINCGKIVRKAVEDKALTFENNDKTSFKGKLKITKRKLIIIISIIILCLIFGGVITAKHVRASQIKEGITLGNKYLQEQKYEEAILTFQKVIIVEPKNIEARVGLAKAYMNIGKPDEAEKILKEAIGINSKKVEPYIELFKLYVNKNNPVIAIKILVDGYKTTNDQSIKDMLEDFESKIAVDDVNKTIAIGKNYSLPEEVTAKINNVEVQFPVKWDETTVDTAKAGTHTFNGTLEDTDKVVKLTLNIIAIASIENINNTVKQNSEYSLPSKVTAKMTDGSTCDVEVIWSPSRVDTSKAETYIYQGTVSGYNKGIKLTLNIESNKKTIELSAISIKNASIKLNNPIQNSVITIEGTGFGYQPPYDGDSQYLLLDDTTENWHAGSLRDNPVDKVTLNVIQWENNKIVISGFTGEYGNYGWEIAPGDLIKVTVWSPTDSSSATYDLNIPQ